MEVEFNGSISNKDLSRLLKLFHEEENNILSAMLLDTIKKNCKESEKLAKKLGVSLEDIIDSLGYYSESLKIIDERRVNFNDKFFLVTSLLGLLSSVILEFKFWWVKPVLIVVLGIPLIFSAIKVYDWYFVKRFFAEELDCEFILMDSRSKYMRSC